VSLLRHRLLLVQRRILKRRLKVLYERCKFFPDSDSVDPEDDEEKGGGDDDEDGEEGAGDGVVRGGAWVILVTTSGSTVQHINVNYPLASIDIWPTIETSHLILIDKETLIILLPHPVIKVIHLTITMKWIAMKVNLLLGSSKHMINQIQGFLIDVPDLVIAEVDISQLFQTLQGEADVSQLIVAKVNVKERWKITKHVIVLDLPNLILLQMQLDQLLEVGAHEDVLEVCQIPLGVHLLGEGICQVKLLQVDKVGEYSGMVHGRHDIQVIVVEDQPLDVVNLVKGLALYLLDLVVGQVDHLQAGVVLPHPEQVPRQPVELVAVEDEDRSLGWDVLQDSGVGEPGVGAVGDPHLVLGPPGLVPGEAAVAPA